jgi:hypothetical protein
MVAREGRCERVRRVVAREGALAKRNLGLARARGAGSASIAVACVIRHRQHVSPGSVWPRTHKAFSSRREARCRMFFSVLQAAKRNGGGIFVAFVRFGSSEKVKLHRCCQSARSNGSATSIPFGDQGRC